MSIIAGITMVKDEIDILPYTIDHMLTQVDFICVLDNNSTDGTGAVLDSLATTYSGRVFIEYDAELAYRQTDKMTWLSHYAGDRGAEWIVPFDADEAWFLPPLPPQSIDVVRVPQYIYIPTPGDDNEPNPLHRIGCRQPEPATNSKVMYRFAPQAELRMGNHEVSLSGPRAEGGRFNHYMYRSLDQARRKIENGLRAHAAAGLSRNDCAHWFAFEGYTDVDWDNWWMSYTTQPGLVCDSWSPT